MEPTANDFEDRDLYLKYVKSQDKLVPCEVMRDREKERASLHLEALKRLDINVDYDRWWWHWKLGLRSIIRYTKWSELCS